MSETYQLLTSLKDRMENNFPEKKYLLLLNKKKIENKAKKDVSTPKNFNQIQCTKISIGKRKNLMTGRVGVKKEKVEKASSIVVR